MWGFSPQKFCFHLLPVCTASGWFCPAHKTHTPPPGGRPPEAPPPPALGSCPRSCPVSQPTTNPAESSGYCRSPPAPPVGRIPSGQKGNLGFFFTLDSSTYFFSCAVVCCCRFGDSVSISATLAHKRQWIKSIRLTYLCCHAVDINLPFLPALGVVHWCCHQEDIRLAVSVHVH